MHGIIEEAYGLGVQGRWEEALALLMQHEATLSGSAVWWRQQGLILEQMQRLEEALERFERAQALAKQDGWLRVDAARVLEKLGRNGEALLRLTSPPLEDTAFPYAIDVSARLAKSTGDDVLLLETARRACALGGGGWALWELGQVLQERRHSEWARQILGSIPAEQPASAPANRVLGQMALAEGDSTEAERCLRLAVAGSPDVWTFVDLAGLLAKRGGYTEAIWVLSQAQIHFPDHPWVLKNAAEYSFRMGSAGFALALRAKLPAAHVAYKECSGFFSRFLLESRNIEAVRGFAATVLAKRAYDLLEDLLTASLRIGDFASYWQALASTRAGGNMDDELVLALIDAAVQGGCLDECEAILHEIAQGSPLRVYLTDMIVLQLCDPGNTGPAAAHFRDTLHSPRSGQNVVRIARQLAAVGIYDEALALLAEIDETDLHKQAALRAVVDIGTSAGRAFLALQALQEIETRALNDAWIGFQIAERLEALGHQAAAIRKLKEIPSGGMPFIAAQRRLLNLEGQLWDAAEKQTAVARAVAGAPKETNGQLELIIFLVEANELAAAWKAHEYLPQEVRNGADGQIAAARILNREGWVKEARERLEALGESAPDAALTLLASLMRDAGDLAGAEAILERVVAGNPRDFWSYLALTDIARQRGVPDRAQTWLAAARPLKPGDAWNDLAQASIDADAGKWEEVLDLLEQTEARYPGQIAVMVRRAQMLRDAGRDAEALAQYASITDRFPNNIETWIDRSEEEFRQGHLTESQNSLARAQQLMPRYQRLLAVLGQRAAAQDDFEIAIELLRQAVAAEPRTLWVQVTLANVLATNGQFAESVEIMDEMEARFGQTPQSIAARADLLRRVGFARQARAILAKGQVQFPDNFHLWFQSVQIDIDLGAFEDAEAAFAVSPAHNAGEKANFHLCRAMLAMARWQFLMAASELHAALAYTPNHGHALSLLSTTQLLSLDLAGVAQTLRSLARLNWAWAELRGDSHNISQNHNGQLLDEFLLGADGLTALRAAQAAPTSARLAMLAAAVQQYPDYTTAAIMWMIEARRQGVFATRNEIATTDQGSIPPRLLQFWDTEAIPEEVAALMRSWPETHPGWEYQRLSSDNARQFLAHTYGNAALAAYDRAREPAMKADIVRLALLGAVGGIYVDADDRCVAAIEPLLRTGDRLIVYQEDLGSIGNNFIAAAPSHPVILDALTRAIDAINRGDSDIVWLSTGPALITRCLAQAMTSEAGAKYLADTRVLTRHELAHYSSVHCLTAYKSTKRHWSRTSFGKRLINKSPAARQGLSV